MCLSMDIITLHLIARCVVAVTNFLTKGDPSCVAVIAPTSWCCFPQAETQSSLVIIHRGSWTLLRINKGVQAVDWTGKLCMSAIQSMPLGLLFVTAQVSHGFEMSEGCANRPRHYFTSPRPSFLASCPMSCHVFGFSRAPPSCMYFERRIREHSALSLFLSCRRYRCRRRRPTNEGRGSSSKRTYCDGATS